MYISKKPRPRELKVICPSSQNGWVVKSKEQKGFGGKKVCVHIQGCCEPLGKSSHPTQPFSVCFLICKVRIPILCRAAVRNKTYCSLDTTTNSQEIQNTENSTGKTQLLQQIKVTTTKMEVKLQIKKLKICNNQLKRVDLIWILSQTNCKNKIVTFMR